MLEWKWDEKCGEAVYVDELNNNKELVCDLYVGNAYLIQIHEYTDNGKDMYTMFDFWFDKEHAKDCLGLGKKGDENRYNRPYSKLIKMRLNRAKCKKAKEIAALLIKAFDDITIEIYSE